MKQIYFLLIAFCFFATTKAQIVNIPDANFKAKLLAASASNTIAKNLVGNYFKIDANNDGEIQKIEAETVLFLNVDSAYINSMEGIQSFVNLTSLSCNNNRLESLDVTLLTKLQILNCYKSYLLSLNVSGLTKLQELYCSSNYLSSLNVSGLTKLQRLVCHFNNLSSLNVSSLVNLQYLGASYNLLTSLDVSSLANLTELDCSYNQQLISLFLKNGKQIYLSLGNNYNLKYICADEANFNYYLNRLASIGYSFCQVNSYCTFIPGGTFNIIQGKTTIDIDANGCDENDKIVPHLKYLITGNQGNGAVIADVTGNFNIALKEGIYTITPQLENLTYFKVSPINSTVTFPTQASPFIQYFCITPDGSHPDLEIIVIPLSSARPGFDAKYKIVYKNKGNQTQSGSVNLAFDDAVLDLVVANPATATQTTNNLSWNFTNLLPFESREITFTLNVNSPLETPAVNGGTILAYNATITTAATDETPIDNTFAFNQTVVNSFDPNDKTCLEGTTISPALIGQYVHYMIRFENSGTANARNIVVKDMIDLSKFDISTLVPISASHSFVTNISAGNKVEFIFENINLPFDDANNDGYIAFKIKTLPTLVVGNTFTNDASIYFDYNFPIVTKPASSTFKTLATQDFEFSHYFTLYPNPAKSVLNISSKETIEAQSISIYNTLGQLVLVVPNAEKVSKIDVSSLTAGNYFIKINSDKGSSNARFIKE